MALWRESAHRAPFSLQYPSGKSGGARSQGTLAGRCGGTEWAANVGQMNEFLCRHKSTLADGRRDLRNQLRQNHTTDLINLFVHFLMRPTSNVRHVFAELGRTDEKQVNTSRSLVRS